MNRKVVFLSAVSAEFHKSDPESQVNFESYRDVLAKSFRGLGPDWYVVTQKDLPQGTGDLLEKLDVEVGGADLIVHLVGNVSGWRPTKAEIRRIKERHEDFLSHEPELSRTLGGLSLIHI